VRREIKGQGEWLVAAGPAVAVVPKGGEEKEDTFDWQGKKKTRVVRTLKFGGEEVEFVKVPAGKFTMGSDKAKDTSASDVETPAHTVTFTKALWVAKYPTTKGQFAAFVKADGYKTEAEADGKGGYGYDGKSAYTQDAKYTWKETGWTQTDQHPVVNVSWNDAEAYTKWASKQGKAQVRLLTEAEYEYANRGGTDTVYFSGDDVSSLEGYANVSDKSAKAKFDYFTAAPFDDGEVFTSPVGKFKANGFGLHDTTGNVWSWCADWYDAKLYQRGDVTDPKANANGEQKYRILRGGSWLDPPEYCRAAIRNDRAPAYRFNIVGFRVCLVLD
jgi:sulfatase modifying factor 1